ncbi:sulfatase [Sulfurifustis variabilis]|uniref:Sulfatase n=1 Tax=Sulfurifustis variabilis TaxID=1675686 RepID=A0A1B4V5D4_9GAMM|nr:LTA synthase family protein [Sulfurifustis variabilis]BAU48738.1 sulfatase [Sulfurifustis variabilis]
MALTIAGFGASVRRAFRARYFPLAVLAALFLAVSAFTRLVLYAVHAGELARPARELPAVLGFGALYDVVAGLYLFAPYALYLFLLPERLHRSQPHRVMLSIATALAVFGLLYLGPVEFFFFDEFNARFNFVAVSYLLYPHEVFVNIWESYPVGRVLAVVALATLALLAAAGRPLWRSFDRPTRWRERAAAFGLMAAVGTAGYGLVDVNTGRHSTDRIANELSQNGVYAFFHALLHNDLDYNQYYVTVRDDEAVARARRLVAQPNSRFIRDAANPLARRVHNRGPEKRLNVVVVVEESLGAEFLGAYGDGRGLTPNLDRLARDSLTFTRVYATGTRTVRGLEAITASFPPIPGESIIKRRGEHPVYTWGEVMRRHGYTPLFVYGGYGSFDGMNAFYGRNGYEVHDRTDMPEPAFANIWGVSDEDLFRYAIRMFDGKHARGEPFFAVVLTTSNHKPFTFPDGVPGVPATGGGRKAGVRYADHAIGKLFEAIRERPYFDETLFVIVGDHGARVYGREDIPVPSYELPLLVYAPRHVPARKVDVLMSQTDIAPTVLGLLGFSYDSVFFGRDVFAAVDDRFVLLSHNRDVALYRPDELVVLGIQKATATAHYDPRTHAQTAAAPDEERIRDAASVFQLGYELYRRGEYFAPEPKHTIAHAGAR